METIEYIKATEKDIQLMVDYRIIFSDELVGKQDISIETNLRESATQYFTNELNKTYLCRYATINGKAAAIAGMCIRTIPGNLKNPSGKWGYIMSVYTVPAHRGKGLCGNLLNHLVDDAREKGITAFELHATPAGEPVYVKNGFEKHNEPTYRKYYNLIH